MADEKGNRRILRVEKELREVIAQWLLSLRGELNGFVSVSRVQVAQDLRAAQVFVSVMGTDGDRESSVETLQDYAHEAQEEVHHQLRMRFTPRLTFHLDTSLEKQLKVEGILRNLELERAKQNKSQTAPVASDTDDDSDDR